jgi:hypothetical protein
VNETLRPLSGAMKGFEDMKAAFNIVSDHLTKVMMIPILPTYTSAGRRNMVKLSYY